MAVITFCEDVSAGGEEETDKPEVSSSSSIQPQGVFLHWASPKKLKYGKPRLGESTLT